MPPRRDPTEDITLTALNEAHIAAAKDNAQRFDALSAHIAAQAEQTNLILAALNKSDAKPKQSPSTFDPQPRPPKLFLPTFDGTNPLDWLFQAEQYFLYYKILPTDRLNLVSFSLSGDALSWFQYLTNNNLLTTWVEFTRLLQLRFGPSSYDNHMAALFKLRQTTTVIAYVTEFERLSNCIVGLTTEALLNCFLSGLRKDIHQELTILRPTSLHQAIGLARLIEDKLNDQRFRFRPTPHIVPHHL